MAKTKTDSSTGDTTDDEEAARDWVNNQFTIKADLPGWLQRFRSTARMIMTNPAAWIIAVLTSLSFTGATEQLQDHSPLVVLLDFFVFRNILLPAATALFNSLVSILDTLVVLIFGSDYAVGIIAGSSVGVVDIPVILAGAIAGALVDGAALFISSLQALNVTIALQFAQLGLPAPALVTAFWATEIAVLLWVGWVLLNLLTIADVITSLTAPVRNFLKLFVGEE